MAIVFCKWGPIPRSQRVLPILYSGLAGSLLATIVVVVAPGNAVREAGVRTYTPALPKTALLLTTIAASAGYLVDFLHTRPLAALGLFVLSWAVAKSQQSQTGTRAGWRSTIYVIIGGWTFAFFLIFIAILPGMYAFSSMPPDRALFVDHWILLLTLIFSGLVFGWFTRRWYLESWVFGLLAAACVVALIVPWAARSARDNLAAIRDLRRYAAEWDNEDSRFRKMRSNGELQVLLPWNASVASNGVVDQIGWISDDPTYFINTCTADYYGFKSLRTYRPDGSHDPQQTTHQALP